MGLPGWHVAGCIVFIRRQAYSIDGGRGCCMDREVNARGAMRGNGWADFKGTWAGSWLSAWRNSLDNYLYCLALRR